MANYNTTKIICENPEVIKSIIKLNEKGEKEIDLNLMYKTEGVAMWVEYINSINEDYKECSFDVASSLPIEDIKQLSRNFPNDIIICHYSFEHNWKSKVYVFEYKNGNEKQTDLLIDYLYCGSNYNNIFNESEQKEITNKIDSFFHQIDKVIKDEEGDFEIEYCPMEVSCTLIYGDYKIKASKICHEVDIELFKKHEEVTVTWIPVSKQDNELPF